MKWRSAWTLSLAMFISLAAWADHTVKTAHNNVNLWSQPGRKGADKIDKVKRFEEANLLAKKKLANGEVWYKIELRRFPGWRKRVKVGWVDARFFKRIEDGQLADEPSEAAAAAACRGCLQQKRGSSKDNLGDLGKVAGAVKGPQSKAGFRWPTKGVLTSGFGMRHHPMSGRLKLHNGIDLARNNGRSVVAAKAGRVIQSAGGCRTGNLRCNGAAGNMVVIDHGNGVQTRYLHLNPSCRLPRPGSLVKQGQPIGCVGSTGASTGPDLHFSVVIRGRYVNPLSVLPRGGR